MARRMSQAVTTSKNSSACLSLGSSIRITFLCLLALRTARLLHQSTNGFILGVSHLVSRRITRAFTITTATRILVIDPVTRIDQTRNELYYQTTQPRAFLALTPRSEQTLVSRALPHFRGAIVGQDQAIISQ